MAPQFSQKHEGLLTPQSSPAHQTKDKLDITSPTTPGSPRTPSSLAPIGSHPASTEALLHAPKKAHFPAKDSSFPPAPSLDFPPRLIPNNTNTVRGRVVIFNTLTNEFTLRTVGPAMTLRSVALTSPRHRIHQMPIRAFEARVNLGEVGVRVGEGRIEDVVQVLPRMVVAMRVLGW